MCTVVINVDDMVMRQINPALTNQEQIARWLQHYVDLMLEKMKDEENEALAFDTTDVMSIEELYATIEDDVKAIYANDAL